jgi:hypothetical protein
VATGSSAARSCSYIKENNIRLGVSVASRKLHKGVVNGFRCRFCLAFGREEKSESKRKRTALGQSWTGPFRYDNIQIPTKNQHAGKCAEYEEAKKSWDYTSHMDQCNQFFVKNAGKSSSVTGHFEGNQPRSLGTGDLSAKRTVFVFDKDIVDVIIGDMYYSPPQVLLLQQQRQEGLNADDNFDAEDDDAENVENQNSTGSEDNASSFVTFDSAAEQITVSADCLAHTIQMKEQALSLFEKQRIVGLDDVDTDNEGENQNSNAQDEGCDGYYQ